MESQKFEIVYRGSRGRSSFAGIARYRREYLARILTYVPETDVIVELANHNAGGLTADMMLTRIAEVDTQDSHDKKTEDEAVDVEEIESKVGPGSRLPKPPKMRSRS
ncbi:unnamed protein product [Caenorhabditis nigoni]